MRYATLSSLLLALSVAIPAQALIVNASAGSQLVCWADWPNTAGLRTAAIGTLLPDGYGLRSFASNGYTATFEVQLRTDAATQVTTYQISETASTVGSGFWGGSHTGAHDTVLTITAPVVTSVVVRFAWTNRSHAMAAIDIDDDGTNDWQSAFQAPTTGEWRMLIGPQPSRIRTRTSSFASFANNFPQSGGGLLAIALAPHVGNVQVVAGADQVAGAGEPFASPVVFRVVDDNGAPLAGVPLRFGVSLDAQVNPAAIATDAQGLAAANVIAGPLGVWLRVTAANGLDTAAASLFPQRLLVTRSTDHVDLRLSASVSALPTAVPFVVLASMPGIPPLATPFGPVCTNPFDPSTLVIEDSLGLFGCVSASGQGAIASPGVVRSYAWPNGACRGAVVQVQAIGFEPTLGVLRTNCATVTL